MAKRQLSDAEKQQVIEQQTEADGSLRCFISGEVIGPEDDVEYDHVHPFSKDGATDLVNIKAVLKKYNRRKMDQSLYDVRDNLRLDRLFAAKKNAIKLQDILALKEVGRRSTHVKAVDSTITIDDGDDDRIYNLLEDPILSVKYFYGRIPMKWIQNDDQEGLQPRVIDYKRLVNLRDHLRTHPQIAPAVARMVDSTIRLFDGQHKVAAQILNNTQEIDVKVYLSPADANGAKNLFDSLMITNLEAHSKLRQVPFYTSTLLERLSVIYKEFWEEFAMERPQNEHSELNFVEFLVKNKGFTRAKAMSVFRAAVKENLLSQSPLAPFVAEASKDKTFPLSQDLMEEIYKYSTYLQPSNALFDTVGDYRNHEMANFRELCKMLIHHGALHSWIARSSSTALTSGQLKARRIWHKGAVLTWAPYLKDIIANSFNMITEEERTKLLYRPEMNDDQRERIDAALTRLFSHTMWDQPEGEIDSLLVSAQKQESFFQKHGLTAQFVVVGHR